MAKARKARWMRQLLEPHPIARWLRTSQKADFSTDVQVDFLNWLNQQDGVPVLIFGTSDISVSVDNILITSYNLDWCKMMLVCPINLNMVLMGKYAFQLLLKGFFAFATRMSWRIRSASMCMHVFTIQSALAGSHDVLLQRSHRHFSWSCSYLELTSGVFWSPIWTQICCRGSADASNSKGQSSAASLPPPHCWNTKLTNRLLSNLFQADSGYCKALGNVKHWAM